MHAPVDCLAFLDWPPFAPPVAFPDDRLFILFVLLRHRLGDASRRGNFKERKKKKK
jgi:hypothetical protein